MISEKILSPSTRYRDRFRSREQLTLLDLTRDLSFLARQHERFAPDLNRLVMRIKYQARSPRWKRREILRAIQPRAGALSLEEIADQTVLDRASVAHELAYLVRRGRLEIVDRDGRRPSERHQGGKFKAYYRPAFSRVLTGKIQKCG